MSSGIAGSWWSSDFLLGGFTSQVGSSLLWQKWLQESFSKTTPVERAASASRFQQDPRIVSHWPDLSHDLPMELDLGFNLSWAESWRELVPQRRNEWAATKRIWGGAVEIEPISMPMVGVCFPGDEPRIWSRKQEGTSGEVPRTSSALLLPTEFQAEPGSIWLDAKYKLLPLFMSVKSRVFNWLASMSVEMGKRPDDWSLRARIWYIESHHQQWDRLLTRLWAPWEQVLFASSLFPPKSSMEWCSWNQSTEWMLTQIGIPL